MTAHWHGWLAEFGGEPLSELLAWAAEQPDARTAWEGCPRADWLLRALALAGADKRTVVLCACECAEQVAASGPERALVEAVASWARDRRGPSWMSHDDASSPRRADPASRAAWAALDAARSRGVADLAEHAALTAIDGPASLAERVRGSRWPPSGPDRRGWPAPVQVAWDLLAEIEIDALSAVEVLCARSVQQGLGPDRRLRALAERLVRRPELGPRVRAVLGEPLPPLVALPERAWCADFWPTTADPSGRFVAIPIGQGRFLVYDVHLRDIAWRFEGEGSWALHPSGRSLFWATEDAIVRASAGAREVEVPWPAPEGANTHSLGLAISSDGALVWASRLSSTPGAPGPDRLRVEVFDADTLACLGGCDVDSELLRYTGSCWLVGAPDPKGVLCVTDDGDDDHYGTFGLQLLPGGEVACLGELLRKKDTGEVLVHVFAMRDGSFVAIDSAFRVFPRRWPGAEPSGGAEGSHTVPFALHDRSDDWEVRWISTLPEQGLLTALCRRFHGGETEAIAWDPARPEAVVRIELPVAGSLLQRHGANLVGPVLVMPVGQRSVLFRIAHSEAPPLAEGEDVEPGWVPSDAPWALWWLVERAGAEVSAIAPALAGLDDDEVDQLACGLDEALDGLAERLRPHLPEGPGASRAGCLAALCAGRERCEALWREPERLRAFGAAVSVDEALRWSDALRAAVEARRGRWPDARLGPPAYWQLADLFRRDPDTFAWILASLSPRALARLASASEALRQRLGPALVASGLSEDPEDDDRFRAEDLLLGDRAALEQLLAAPSPERLPADDGGETFVGRLVDQLFAVRRIATAERALLTRPLAE